MCRSITRLFVILSFVAMSGCSSANDDESTGRSALDESRAAIELPAMASYRGPPFRFDVQTEGSATQFRWSVTAPTGGWKMKFDGAVTSPRTGHATIRVLLTRPDPSDMVTQALVTHDGDYRHGAIAFESADLLVKLVTRGESADGIEYARAAIWQAGE